MKKLWSLLLLALAFGLSRDAPRARACGGAWVVAPQVVGLPHLLDDYDELSELQPEDQLFLYPFKVAYPNEAKTIWSFAYENLEQLPAPDETAFQRAQAKHDVKQARKEAQRLLDAWYALPAPLASPHRDVAFRAANFLEPPPAGSAGASEQFVGIMQAFARGVPKGWASVAKNQVPATLWSEQLKATGDWLRDHPQHPLVDLVRFWEVRVHYFAGDSGAAWGQLFKLYPRRRVRALNEMRYLIRVGQPPSATQLEALTDPLLAASLVSFDITPARWNRYWRLSEKAASKPSAMALQVRLLQAIVQNGDDKAPLPSAFPAQPPHAAQLWGELRAIILIRHGRPQEARQQLLSLEADPNRANILANCHLALGDPIAAARVPKLAAFDVSYIVQVLVPLADIAKLRGDADPIVASEAEFRAAAEAIRSDDFGGAAKWYKQVDAPQGADLERMAKLKQQGDELGLARALKARGNQLGLGMPTENYRGFDERYAQLASGSSEAQGLVARLEASSGGFQALRHYVPWLETHAQATNARAVLAEADATYVRVQAYGGWEGMFWDKYLTHHDLAVRLRRVGKQIRATGH